MSNVNIPKEPPPVPGSPLLRTLTVAASGLTAASIAVNLILQVAHYMKKEPVRPDQRTKLEGAGLALTVLKTMPGLIKQTRLFTSQLRGEE